MTTSSDFSTLGWIKDELNTILAEARQLLEEFVEGSRDPEVMNTCGHKLHQVSATLQMVQVYGAAMLVQEMEQLARAFAAGQVHQRQEAAETLMMSLIRVPDYLEKVQGGEPDIPLALLPLINDLRSSRDEPLMSEAALFHPSLESAPVGEQVDGIANPELGDLARRSRPSFHKGLLAWYRGTQAQVGLAQVAEVVESLESASHTAPSYHLFRAARGVLAGLADQSIESGLAVKKLIGRLDRSIKLLIDQGESGLAEAFPEDLVKNLLYYVGQAQSDHPGIVEVKEDYALGMALPSQEMLRAVQDHLAAPGIEILNTVREAIKEDLVKVKDGLDLYMRGARDSSDGLLALEKPLRAVGDTLGMIGQGALRARLIEEADRIHGLAGTGEVPEEGVLLDMAGDIVFVEAGLDRLGTQAGRRGAEDELVVSTMREVEADISRAKEAVEAFVSAPEGIDRMKHVQGWLHNVAGAFRILKHDEPAQILDGLCSFIERAILGSGATPNASELGALAEVVSSVEYFAEALSESRGEAVLRKIADTARESLDRLVAEGSAEAPVEAIPEEEPILPREEAVASELTTEPETESEPEPETPQAVPPQLRQPAAEREEEGAIDDEVREIFLEEAGEELASIADQFSRWKADFDDAGALASFRRSFHTLKGSGRMVGARAVGELAWAVENLLNRFIEGGVCVTPEVVDVLDASVAAMPGLVEDFAAGRAPITDVGPLAERAFALAGAEVKPAPKAEEEIRAERGEESPAAPKAAEAVAPAAEQETDEEILEVFAEEAEEELASIREHLPAWLENPENRDALTTFRRSFHTLKGSGRMVGATVIGELSWSIENLLNRVIDGSVAVSGEIQDLLREVLDVLPDLVEEQTRGGLPSRDVQPVVDRAFALAAPGGAERISAVVEAPAEGESPPEAVEGVSVEAIAEEGPAEEGVEAVLVEEVPEEAPVEEAVDEISAESVAEEVPGERVMEEIPAEVEVPVLRFGMDPVLFQIFEQESRGYLETLVRFVAACRERPEERAWTNQVTRAFHTLHGSAHMASVESIAAVSGALERLARESVAANITPDDETVALIEEGVTLMDSVLKCIRDPNMELPGPETLIHKVLAKQQRLAAALAEASAAQAQRAAAAVGAPPAEPAPSEAEESLDLESGYFEVGGDPDLVEIFLEEAGDLLESLDGALRTWRANPDDTEVLGDMQRSLHTLKGGARLAGILPSGDLSHAFETLLTGLSAGDIAFSPEIQDLAQEAADRLSAQLEEVSRSSRVRSAEDLISQLEGARAKREEVPEAPPPEAAPPVPARAGVAPTIEIPAAKAREAATQARVRQELVRVRSDLLDRLVNNAGEISIYRSRLEEQNGSVGFHLAELEQTVDRLRSQLRQLEIETEAQILFRYERDREEDAFREDFDPLEMDRFSTMQQLSRSLIETVNDLANIRTVLEDLNRETETLLLQQSRVSNDLQNGLLHTRMVPFSQVVPRLHRLVRQTCKSLDKKAELEVYGADEEMDRNILDRMVAPLEHILRNAVSHGIESPDARLSASKKEAGSISVYVGREGTDVVLHVVDDGGGMRLDAIRERAIERGLLDPRAKASDEDIMQFVLAPGFSTASVVTQVAGRGVGMDVVASGIKQLGGSLEMATQLGQGTSFTIRLPLTLAISEALLAKLGEEIYAIPYASIEGVVRIGRAELEELYHDSDKMYGYGGSEFRVRYLGGLLGSGGMALPEGRRWYPVLLVRSGEHRVALQVDDLLGNRQIVVKSVGPQLSSIQWITGGTILGDGRVALILDLNAMIRQDAVRSIAPAPEKEEMAPSVITVMVVDDSITVRKVTSRLLNRHNMQVVTAKDGMDAVTKLQDQIPDVMLLDIEMPRMDGFELVRHMRNIEELKRVPVIMITSRTGEKHRDRAFQLGVQRYLGKPYQESDLLDNIYAVLSEASV